MWYRQIYYVESIEFGLLGQEIDTKTFGKICYKEILIAHSGFEQFKSSASSQTI